MTSNVINFISYRADYVQPRDRTVGIAMSTRRINHAHNLRLRYERRRIITLERHSFYLPVPKFAGGDDTRGRLPSKINKLINGIRAIAEPALVISWPAVQIVKEIG